MANGGDILQLKFSHPDIGQGVFYPKSNEGNTLDIGGFRTADEANMISSVGEPVFQMNMQRGSIEVVCINDMNIRNDIDLANQLTESSKTADWTITMQNGTVWGGTGKPVGDIQADTNASTFTLKISGGRFKKIVG